MSPRAPLITGITSIFVSCILLISRFPGHCSFSLVFTLDVSLIIKSSEDYYLRIFFFFFFFVFDDYVEFIGSDLSVSNVEDGNSFGSLCLVDVHTIAE